MKRKLLFAMVALLSIVGVRQANADTSLLTAGNGWTKITELPTDVSLYYFTIVDDSRDLMLTLSRGLDKQQQEGYNGLFYATSANPLVDKGKLFSLEKDGDNYVMRNVEYNGYFLQTEYNAAHFYHTHDNGGGDKSWGRIKFTYANSVWTIQNAKYPVDNGNYLGMWEDADPANGKSLALNKANEKKGTFQIYSILKTDVDAYYASLKIANAGVTPETPVDMTGLIVNPNARFWTGSIPFGWTTTGTQNVNNGNGYDQFPGIFEFSNWGAGSWKGSLKQTITVPNGKYRLKAAVMAAEGVTAYLTANSDKSDNLLPIGASGGNINPDGTETTPGGGQRGYKYLTVETLVTTGSLELGAYGEASAAHLWVNADNFTLSYLDPSISALAFDLPDGGAMVAGQWYKYVVAYTAEYTVSATTAENIKVTEDVLVSEYTDDTAIEAGAHVNLTAGTYYYKSTSNNTLTITLNDPRIPARVSLLDKINEVATARKEANEGSGVFQIPASAGTTLAAAKSAAQDVYDDGDATLEEITTATSTLNTAIETYEATTLNAPASGARYYLKIATSGHAKENQTVVLNLGATSANNPTGYSSTTVETPAAYKGQALTFTHVSGNNYKISVERPEGTVYLTYGSLNGSAAGWNKLQIQATTVAANAGEFKIEASATANVFNIYNTVFNDYIVCQPRGSLYTDSNIDGKDFTLAEASQATVSILAKPGKYGTVIYPFTPDVSGFDDITFYSCSSQDGETVVIEPVDKGDIEANIPYVIKNTGETDYSASPLSLTGWGTAAADSYTADYLTGIFTNATIPANSYVLQTQDDVQKFYKLDEEATGVAYRAYLTIPSPAKVLRVVDGTASEVTAPEVVETEEPEVLYNMAGIQVDKNFKGVVVNQKGVKRFNR